MENTASEQEKFIPNLVCDGTYNETTAILDYSVQPE